MQWPPKRLSQEKNASKGSAKELKRYPYVKFKGYDDSDALAMELHTFIARNLAESTWL